MAEAKKDGNLFVEAGLITLSDLDKALQEKAKKPEKKIGEILIEQGLLSERDIAQAYISQLGFNMVDLSSVPIESEALFSLNEEIAIKYSVMPISMTRTNLKVAMFDPLDVVARDFLAFFTDRRIVPFVAVKSEINSAIKQYYAVDDTIGHIIKNIPRTEKIDFVEREVVARDIFELDKSEMTPVAEMVNQIIIDGINSNASDMHLEPRERILQVRKRIDGQLYDTMRIPKWLQSSIISRIKVIAELDIAERRLPQDGKIKIKYKERCVDLRISTLPTNFGEKIVIRILDRVMIMRSLAEVGFLPKQMHAVMESLYLPQGTIFVTGPTGSGKTTTQYGMVNELLKRDLNIITIEDPIEYEVSGASQVQVNDKAGLTFASCLRSVLRQDPNVILVGEIRDVETAKLAVQASMTGHVVLSTLHTKDSVSSITRLLNLEIEPYLIASSISLIIAQRLVRIICPKCREEYSPPEMMLKRLESYINESLRFTFYKGKGCDCCHGTGYKGRIGVFEVLKITPKVQELIIKGASESLIKKTAIDEGMASIFEDAIEKMKKGITTLEEIEKVVVFIEDETSEEGMHSVFCKKCNKLLEHLWLLCPYCGAEKVKTKVVLIETDPILTKKITEVLEKDNVRVIHIEDGYNAVEIIKKEKPLFVVLDLDLVGLPGNEVSKRLRAEIATAFVPLLILTSQEETINTLIGYIVGHDQYIMKPLDEDKLMATFQQILKSETGS